MMRISNVMFHSQISFTTIQKKKEREGLKFDKSINIVPFRTHPTQHKVFHIQCLHQGSAQTVGDALDHSSVAEKFLEVGECLYDVDWINERTVN